MPPQTTPDLSISLAIISDLVRQIDSVHKQNDQMITGLNTGLATIKSSLANTCLLNPIHHVVQEHHVVDSNQPTSSLHKNDPPQISVKKDSAAQTRHSTDPRFSALQKDNSSLQATLKEYQSTLELIMTKFRAFALAKQQESSSKSDTTSILLEQEKQKTSMLELEKAQLLAQLDSAHSAIRQSIDLAAHDFGDLSMDVVQLETESTILRESLNVLTPLNTTTTTTTTTSSTATTKKDESSNVTTPVHRPFNPFLNPPVVRFLLPNESGSAVNLPSTQSSNDSNVPQPHNIEDLG